jgi:UDP-N-acetyl-D-glucosamine/UDP-N-acetyl-D-galactosamine dehydrogenase
MRRRSISSPKVYGSLVTAGIHRTPSIQVAEAAKVIENTQRDLNIAFMNELSLSFRQSISTRAAAVATRSRQQEPNGISFPFSLGLPVATASASILITWLIEPRRPLPSRGYSGRPPHQRRNGASDCARMHPRLLRRKGRGGIVTILGVPFKGRAGYPQFTRDVVRELQAFGVAVQIVDPLADPRNVGGIWRRTIRHRRACALLTRSSWRSRTTLASRAAEMKLNRSAKPSCIELWRL